MTTCPLCSFEYEPGGSACRDKGCPLAGPGCRTLHCPRCGYTVPDESASVVARWLRRLFPARPAAGPRPRTLADLRPGEQGVVEAIEGDPARRARLTAQGLAPGVPIALVQRVPSFVLEIGETTLAVERRVAEGIQLRQ